MRTFFSQNNRELLFLLAGITLISCSSQKTSHDVSGISNLKEISLLTADSITVYGDILFQDSAYPTILLFHQGGSNARAEYAPVIKQLLDELPKINILAIDQRSGGQTYGSYNRTVFRLSPYKNHSMCDTYSDLEAALNYITKRNVTGPVIVWGSSYSGSLAIQLAAKNGDSISAVLAFSPASGGPMANCKPDDFFEGMSTPLLVLRPEQELQIESVQKQFELLEQHGHQTYVAQNGVHGSSMLVSRRTGSPVDLNWNTILNFINKIAAN